MNHAAVAEFELPVSPQHPSVLRPAPPGAPTAGPEMSVTVAAPCELTDRHWADWLRAFHAAPTPRSPFLHPVYAQRLAGRRPGVEVIVMGLPDGTSGFLPFERTGPRTGGPLGIKLADFQGLVAAPGASWSVAEVLAGARLDCLAFDHLVLDGSPLEAHVLVQEPSPVVDLGSGFEAYLADLRAAGSVLLPQVERKHRALVRKSHVEFCWRDDSTQAFAELVNWKQAQRRESHSIDVLGWAGVVELLNELRAVRRDGFEGVLSTLRIDGQYAAVHFGLRAGPVVHWWFTGYSPAFRRHSPGLLLLLLAAEAAARDGVQRIDLGKGDDAYKASFANRWTQVGVGAADTFVLRRWARRGWSRLRRWVKDSPLRGSARRTKQLWRRWRSLTAPR